jgi:hypothetical protein
VVVTAAAAVVVVMFLKRIKKEDVTDEWGKPHNEEIYITYGQYTIYSGD